MPWPRRNSGWRHSSEQNDKWHECLAEAAKAVAIWAVLARERPDAIEYRQRQAECQGLVAVAYGCLGRFDETDRENQVALGLAEELVKEHPDSIDCRYLLGQLIYDSARPRSLSRRRAGL